MARKSILEMDAAPVWELLVQKAEKKGRTRAEAEEIMNWLTGYTPEQLRAQLERGVDYGTLFREAPAANPRSRIITGSICGVRVEEIEDPVLHDMRVLDKLIDELAKGRPMERILRVGEPGTVEEYIAAQEERVRPYLTEVRETIRQAIPQAREIVSWGMPTYRGNGNVIHFAAAKRHLGIYPGEEATAHFAEGLKDYHVSKGTIQIPYREPLPLELIGEIAVWSWENLQSRRSPES